jgi:CSLREA domain-containing protein
MARPAALVAATFVAAALALTVALPAQAAQTITVGPVTDTVDPSPADGICQVPCTLRAAVQTANGAGSAGADTIVLPAGTYNRTVGGSDGADPAATGDLDVTGDLTITGGGQATTTVDGKSLERVFDVLPGVTADFSGMTITGGLASDGFTGTAGGGVRVGEHTGGSATATLSDVTLIDNVANDGAGVATDAAGTSLTLNRVSVLDNNPPAAGNAEGGGVNERFGGTVTINNSLVSGNTADAGAGVTDDGGGTITINDSTVSDNDADPTNGQTGGVYETGGGNVTLNRSTVSGNTAPQAGGVAEDGGGTVTIVDSTISDNHTVGSSSLAGDAGGVLRDGGGTVSIRGSAIVGNTAEVGGGIEDFGGTGPFDIVNTTISGNQATTRGGGIHAEGPGALTLTNVTLRDNTGGAGASDIDNCNGVPSCSGAPDTINVRNTIVASGGVNCFGPTSSGGNNLDSGSTCGFGAAGDLKNTAPLLGALANNGGPTVTHAELTESPTIDRGNPAICPGTDQRGFPRPFGPACDIGAFEGGTRTTVAAVPQCQDKRDNDGDGAIDLQDPGCKNGADGNEGDESLQDLVLCGKRQISLVRADAKGRRVVLSGLVSQANNGKSVQLFANYSTKKKAKGGRFTRLATVRASAKNGQFTARLKRPPARLFNKARFFARVGKARSVALKLPQSLASSSVRKVGSNIELRGTVKRSVLGKRNAIVVRRIVCGRYQSAGTAKPSKRGRYVVRFPAPKVGAAALYRAETRVLARPRSKRYVKQFARALGITLAG